jgi:hypothetical protein
MAVDATIGDGDNARAVCGTTYVLGLRVNGIMMKPVVAFQKPIASHGVVAPNNGRRRRST